MTETTVALETDAATAAAAGMSPDEADAEGRYQAYIWTHLRRNFAALLAHGMMGRTGFRLINAPTFMPAYLFMLSGSSMVVGLALGLQQLGQVLSPIIGAAHMEHRKRVLPVGFLTGGLMRLQILGLALVGFFLAGTPLVVATVFFLFTFGLFMGPQRVVLQLLLSKVIPVERRGFLVGMRNFFGGLVAAVVGYVGGSYFIEHNVLGNGYATTLLFAFACTALGLCCLAFVKEPEPPRVRAKASVGQRFRELPALLRSDRGYFYFFFASSFSYFGRMGMPFYILYAGQQIELTGTNIGLFTLTFLLADTVGNVAFGLVADRIGFRWIFLTSLVLWIGAALLLMGVHNVYAVFAAFAALGWAVGGVMLSSPNLLLEFGTRDDLPMRIALANTAESIMATAGPILGGVIVVTFSYAAVFWTAIIFQAMAAVIIVFFVDEPRHREAEG